MPKSDPEEEFEPKAKKAKPTKSSEDDDEEGGVEVKRNGDGKTYCRVSCLYCTMHCSSSLKSNSIHPHT